MNFIKEKILNHKNIRTLIQVISFIAFTGIFTLTYGSLKSIYTCVIKGDFDLSTCLPQLIIISALFLLTAIAGRFFCGWMCAFGTLMDFLHFISYKVTGKSIIVNYKLDKVLKLLKYIVLAGSIIFIWTLGLNLFGGSNPWDVFGTYTSFDQSPEFSQYIKSNWFGVVILAIIIIGGLFIERFFCRYLCPLGAIFSIFSKFRVLKIKKLENSCGKCSCCSKSCSMGININPKAEVASGECINCFKCIEACPRENSNVSAFAKPLRKNAVMILSVLVILVIGTAYYGATYIDYCLATDVSNIDTTQLNKQGEGTFTDGTYEGTGSGFKGSTTVSVTVTNGYITNIETVSTGDDMPYYNRAFSSIAEQIISSQEVSVDAVTGATFSSNGIMEAVSNALGQEFKNNNDQLQRGHGGRGPGNAEN